MNLQSGSQIIYKRGDDEWEAVVDSVEYTSSTPAVYAELTRRQKILRALTPKRWRKPIPIVREARGPEIRINTVDMWHQRRRDERLAEWLDATSAPHE
ncbi:hypothetical protein PBI_MIAZEAL_124 [Mycobacterium phage MiaZeal]|uniref:hypothetical protein n=1 Tax=Mycobacterium phage MiaZeal TaxID=1567005 RepID=UPI000540F9A2|nr:hypothetical protein AVV70_gp124 [Mycobacterium phage MiaZeal]AIY32478.1 hypothetical protein PBI_MIAZEAL_124 [Mycobacterium phage MiaZeal]